MHTETKTTNPIFLENEREANRYSCRCLQMECEEERERITSPKGWRPLSMGTVIWDAWAIYVDTVGK